jgi:hypothetical protein
MDLDEITCMSTDELAELLTERGKHEVVSTDCAYIKFPYISALYHTLKYTICFVLGAEINGELFPTLTRAEFSDMFPSLRGKREAIKIWTDISGMVSYRCYISRVYLYITHPQYKLSEH